MVKRQCIENLAVYIQALAYSFIYIALAEGVGCGSEYGHLNRQKCDLDGVPVWKYFDLQKKTGRLFHTSSAPTAVALSKP